MKTLLGLTLAGVVLLTGCSGKLQKFTASDAHVAQQIALAANDPVWAECMGAIEGQVTASAALMDLKPVGLLSLVTKVHVLRAAGAVSPDLKAKCAPVAMDILVTVTRAGVGAFPGGGSLGVLLGR